MKQLFMVCQTGIRSDYHERTCVFTPLFLIIETGFETIEDAEKRMDELSERYINSVLVVMSYFGKVPKVYGNVIPRYDILMSVF